MATFKLPFAPHLFRLALEQEISDYEFIEEVMHTPIAARQSVCAELLQNYIGEGAPSCEDFNIEEVNFDHHTRTGTIAVRFEINFYYGCEDINNSRKFSETISFKLDFAAKQIAFTIPEDIKRNTIDEF